MLKILLHACCGPCSTHVVDYLKKDYEVTVYFYDPNIQPKEEYDLRLASARIVAEKMQVPLIEGPYDEPLWRAAIKGLEDEPENGKRCAVCYGFRLRKAATYAKDTGFDIFTTTLTISPYKNAKLINAIGETIAKKMGINFLSANFKKKDGNLNSIRLSKEMKLYRQDYCGCRIIASPNE